MIRTKYYTLPSAPNINFNTPTTLVLDKDYVKNALKSDLNRSDDDAEYTGFSYINDLIQVSTQDSEKFTMRAYLNRDITVTWQKIVDEVTLPVAGYNSIVSVHSINPDNGTLTAITAYNVISKGDYVNVKFDTAQTDPIRIIYNAGYGASATDMPSWVRDAVSARVVSKYSMKPMDVSLHNFRFMSTELTHQFIYYNQLQSYQDYDIDTVFPTAY